MQFGADIMERLAAAGPEGILRTEADGFQWRQTESDFLGRIKLPMEEFAATIKQKGKVQLLCLHGRQDTTIPWQESETCAKLSGENAKFVLVDGDHNYREANHAQHMSRTVVQFCTS